MKRATQNRRRRARAGFTLSLFQGEMMKCHGCGKEQKSDPRIESNWNYIEIPEDKTGFYVCPDCFAKWIRGDTR